MVKHVLRVVCALSLCAGCGGDGSDDAGGDPSVVAPPGGMVPGPTPTQPPTPIPTQPPITTEAGAPAPTPVDPNVPPPETAVPMGTPTANPVDGVAIPAECQGLDMQGMVYSPGGNALPDICQPFHPTLNNPYAIRCIDAWPWYSTQFPGDEFCILPPPPELGVQFGMHPHGSSEEWFAQVSAGDMSGYASPSDPWLMSPGEEEEANYYSTVANPTQQNYYRNYVRMRAGSHHMINSAGTGGTPGTWGPGSAAGLSSGTSLPGAQRPDENTPKSLDKPAEDAGLYSVLPANPSLTFNVHHFNATSEVTLKEAWINLWWEQDAAIRVEGIRGLSLLMTIGTFAQPGQIVDHHYVFNVGTPTRILTLFGHRHAWTTNFSAWVERPGGENEIVYQSFDWFDQPTYRYDSQTENPAPAPDLLADGGHSGVLEVQPGERLHFNCHMRYNDERAAEVDGPSPATIGALRFANEAFTGEMCILFGTSAGANLGTPVTDPAPVPSFASVD